jgi:hypothetical protein
MKEQVLDIWEDMRERRLWPVAALLLIALVAVPVVLVKPAEETPSQAATPTPAANPGDPLAKQSVVKAFEAKPLVKISKLDQFTAKNPFKPIESLKPLSGSDVVAVTPNGSGSTAGSRGGASAPSGGGGGGGGGGGTTTPGGGSNGTTPGAGGGTKPAPAKKFTFVVDLSFRAGKDHQRYQSFARLGMLPSETSPLLVYLGVDGTGSQAAFLVDSTLTASGEGQCRPSAQSCGVVYLQPGEKETFSDSQGRSYALVLDQIRKVEVKAKGSGANAKRAKKAHTADQHSRRFMFPVLIDMEIGGHS